MKNNSEAPKRRGRPPGSKNKKTRVPVTNPSETTLQGNGMGLHLNFLEVPAGRDVIAAVYDFTNCNQLGGVSVASTHGFVRNVTLYQPNMPTPLYTYKDAYQLLYLMGNFYGSSSSIRPLSPFPTRHIVSLDCGERGLCVGTVQGKLTAATNVVLGLSFINGTESIKLPMPPPRALPAPQNFNDRNGDTGRSMTATATGGLLSGTGSSRSATGGLLSGTGSSRSATGALTEVSSGAVRFKTATAGLLNFFSGAGRSMTATARLPEFSSGAGRSMTATASLPEFSSGAGRSGTDYVVTTAPSPLSSISWNPMINNVSSTSGSKEERSNY